MDVTPMHSEQDPLANEFLAAHRSLTTGPLIHPVADESQVLAWADSGAGVPDAPGLYAVVAIDVLPVRRDLGRRVPVRGDGLLYVGKAETSLHDRLLQSHFHDGATAHATLRRTLASLLTETYGLDPIPAASAGKFRLTTSGKRALTQWMSTHLGLRVWESEGLATGQLAGVEKCVIDELNPPLNLTFGHSTPEVKRVRAHLRAARAEMAHRALHSTLTLAGVAGPTKPPSIGDLFQRYPAQFGLRGDVGLWEELAERLEDAPMPGSWLGMRNVVEQEITLSLQDAEPHDEKMVHVDRFDRGGMSHGLVSLRWWDATGVPLLVDRWSAWAEGEGHLNASSYLGGR